MTKNYKLINKNYNHAINYINKKILKIILDYQNKNIKV